VFLLRGNHETRDVNGWYVRLDWECSEQQHGSMLVHSAMAHSFVLCDREEHYGARAFMYQCRSRFGDDLGYRVWEGCNQGKSCTAL
jgi:hypothetical protein